MGSRPRDYTWREICVDVNVMALEFVRLGLALLPVLTISACAARSATSVPAATKPPAILEVRQGLASYYGPGFEGKQTASGIAFDKTAMVAAHPTYPFGTVVRVTNLANQRQVLVRVVDRGPAKGPRAQGVVIDVSSGAAANLGFVRQGRTRVRLEVLRWGG
jgi:rare lipoprotein A